LKVIIYTDTDTQTDPHNGPTALSAPLKWLVSGRWNVYSEDHRESQRGML